MKQQLILTFLLCALFINGCLQKETNNSTPKGFSLVKGGTIKNQKSKIYGLGIKISDFHIGKYEVTQKEWKEIMKNNPSTFKGDNLPVESVTWYDCIEYCNQRSLKEGLTAYYNINKELKDSTNILNEDSIKWSVSINTNANGYRLPSEIEWQYAAEGGQLSNSYTYGGSNFIDEVAWHFANSGDSLMGGLWNSSALYSNNCRSRPVGQKKPNELGIYDMSGNVYELCQDWYEDEHVKPGQYKVVKGGSWMAIDMCSKLNFRNNFGAHMSSNDAGFRVCRNI